MSTTFNPSTIQESLAVRLPQYLKINDCIAGSDAIKKGRTSYLPKPNADDDSEENAAAGLSWIENTVGITSRKVVPSPN